MYNTEAPQRSADVQITFDRGDPWCYPACFSPQTTDIYLHTSRGSTSTSESTISWDDVAHEYGHYISWTYGDSGWWCNHGVDEGDAVEEVVADVVAFAVGMNSNSLRYSAPWMRVNPEGLGPHVLGVPTSEATYRNRCSEEQGYYRQGDFARQAFWEVMNDRDEELSRAIFGSGPLAASRTTLNLLGYALNRLGPDITFSDLILKMSEGIGSLSSRERFKAVFRHHGLPV
jgi:hypothetical protein